MSDAPSDLDTTGGRIRALREAIGLSQRQLAERLGRTQPAVAHWEANRFRPSEPMQAALERELGVPRSFFMRPGR